MERVWWYTGYNIAIKNRLNKLFNTMTSKLVGINDPHVYTTCIDSVASIKNKSNAAFAA